jgi:molecular chaperone GrpE
MTKQTPQTDDAQRILDLEQQLQEKDEGYRRALADYQNVLRRSADEKRTFVTLANQGLMSDLLPTLDHLSLAVQHFPDPSLKMIWEELQKVVEAHGLAKFEPIGEAFNAQTMEAVDVEDGKQDTVLKVRRVGYKLGNYILRPAEVIVGKESK